MVERTSRLIVGGVWNVKLEGGRSAVFACSVGGLVHGRVEANARLFASVFVSLLCVCVCVCCALSMCVCVCELLLLLLLLLFGALLSC